MAMTVVISYDVSNDSRRSRLAALLQVWGDRVQLSVFVISITPQDLHQLLEKADACMDPDHDSLHVFRQCQDCWEDRTTLGQGTITPPPVYWAIT